MGRLHKRFNQKGRQVVNTVIDESEQNKIKIDIPESASHYDGSNALVLPSAKRKTKKLRDKNAAPVKLLSKKQRKKLEKIADKKLKRSKREELLEELKKVQLKPKDMEAFTSLQTIQTLGRKKYLSTTFEAVLNPSKEVSNKGEVLNYRKWKTPKSIKREMKLQEPKPKRLKRDYSVVQSESSSSSSEDEDECCDDRLHGNVNSTDAEKSENSIETAVNGIKGSETEDKVAEIDSKLNTKENLEVSDKEKQMKEKQLKSGTQKGKCVGEIENGDSKMEENVIKKKKKATLVNNSDEQMKLIVKKEKKVSLVDIKDEKKLTTKKKKKKVALKDHVDEKMEDMVIKKKKKVTLKNKTDKELTDEELKLIVKKLKKVASIDTPDEQTKLITKKMKKMLKEHSGDKMKETKLKKVKKKKKINDDSEKSTDIKQEKLKKVIKKKKNDNNEKSTDIEDKSLETSEEVNNNTINNCNDDEQNSEQNQSKTPTFKLVKRDPEIQKHRLKLPILSEEHAIMEAINENQITIVVGPTGSGKTTQIPQFLYEAGYTNNGMKIAVTEPRRIAAISMSERVGYELNLPSSKVSYKIRYENNVTPDTEIEFMTDGVLFQEVKNNHSLDGYSAIIIDEVHERSIHSDILLGLLSRIVPMRNEKEKPLKLIIMSATPRIEDFTQNANLFKKGIPPVIKVPSRMYRVEEHFSRTTDSDYCEAAFKKVCLIHRLHPEGGILVFLSGQSEILELCKLLKETFPMKQNGMLENDSFDDENKNSYGKRKRGSKKITIPEINLKDFATKSTEKNNEEIEDEMDIPDEEIFCEEISKDFLVSSEQPLWVLPLFSLLPSHKQKRVFQPPPKGTRLCVVATNIAETSLTIPHIKYVIDSGKTKEKLYDPVTGISSYLVSWTSKASAKQRCGRAGRTSDGHCFRLYSSAVYNDEFPEYTIPDIQKRPLDDVVLTMKALKLAVYKFPFPSPPDPKHLSESFKRLTILGALEEDRKLLSKRRFNDKEMDITVITNLGLDMSHFAMAPRFAKMIVQCHVHPQLYPYVVIIIAALTVREIFIEIPLARGNMHPIHQNWGAQRIKWGGKNVAHGLGDLLVLINAVLEAEKNDFSYQWCYENGLRHSAVLEYRKLRRQITNEINFYLENVNLTLQPGLKPPTDNQAVILAEIIYMGSIDQVARKVDSSEFESIDQRKMWRNAYRTVYSDQPVFLSSSSVLYKHKPQYIMYQDINETTKVYLRCTTVVKEAWMLYHSKSLADLSLPLDDPPPSFYSEYDSVMCHRKGTFGPKKWEMGPCLLDFPSSSDLFKWVAYFFLNGEMCPPLKPYVKDLYDPKIIINRIAYRRTEKKRNLIDALISEDVTSASSLQRIWKEKNPYFLKREYFAWIENQDIMAELNHKWPPLEEEKFIIC